MGSAGIPLVVVVAVLGIFAAFVPLINASADPLCEGLSDNEIYPFPHEYNCSLFYECYNGNKTVNVCPGGLYYNPETQSCDFPELSGCTNGNGICTDIDLDYFPYPNDCQKYIECYQGESYEMDCPADLYFDSISKKCVPALESDCVTTPTPSWTTPNAICQGIRPDQTHLFAHPDDCHLYWKCTGASLTLESCPPYLYFDEDRQLCDFPETVDCGGGTRTADPSTSTPLPVSTTPIYDDPRCINDTISYLPHPVNCDMYIECYNGASYEMNCPPGLYFSEGAEHCVMPSQSECGRTPTAPRTTVTFPTGWTSDPDCPYPEAEGRLYPYPGDCTKFYICAEGKKVAMDCPSDLWFNSDPDVYECDYPYQTDCLWGKLSLLERVYRFFFRR